MEGEQSCSRRHITDEHRKDGLKFLCGTQDSVSPLPLRLRESNSLSSESQTLESIQLKDKDRQLKCSTFSQLLEGVVISSVAGFDAGLVGSDSGNSSAVDFRPTATVPPVKHVGFEGKFEMSHQEVLATMTVKATEDQAVIKQSELTVPNTTLLQQQQPVPAPVPKDVASVPEMEHKDSSVRDRETVKTPSDGYNWRKYGQKQLKSMQSSRSYYRCSYSDCCAKKRVLQSDKSGIVTEVVYKGKHSHDLPKKIRCSKLRRSSSSAGSIRESETVDDPPDKRVDDLDTDASMMKSIEASSVSPTPEQEEHNSNGLYQSLCSKVEEKTGDKFDDEEEGNSNDQLRRGRMKERGVGYAVPLVRNVKEPKIVLHAAGDVGTTNDGYRWRKYGQKKVKGNPHPRSYYRCTSAGCPVRKHMERAADDTMDIIVTYEGIHDHDMPVPKNPGVPPPSAALVIATAAAMHDGQFNETEIKPNLKRSPTQCLVDTEGEKALESARTLLSIGFELKPC